MNKKDFIDKVNSFDLKRYKIDYQVVEEKRRDFVCRFSPKRIRKMDIDKYVQGKGMKEDNFCYELEWKLGAYGLISGSTAIKYGIYFNKKDRKYKLTKAWDKGSVRESFRFLANALADLIENAEADNLDEIRKSPFSKMVKGKILATYYPEKYLSIFSEDHLDYFIQRLNLDNKLKEDSDVIDKRQILIDFKESIPEMKKWPLHAFSYFLYRIYPGAPKDNKEKVEFIKSIEMVEKKFISLHQLPETNRSGKGDYESQNRKKRELGERGEFIVMQWEKEQLRNKGIKKPAQQKSLTDDSLGYDILSFNDDDTCKYIEVKATNSSPTDFILFLSSNELSAAERYGENYHIYIVFSPFSSRPIITDIGNPSSEDSELILIPDRYVLHLKEK